MTMKIEIRSINGIVDEYRKIVHRFYRNADPQELPQRDEWVAEGTRLLWDAYRAGLWAHAPESVEVTP